MLNVYSICKGRISNVSICTAEASPRAGYPRFLSEQLFRYLVIDEADRMMNNIADEWLGALEAAVFR